MRYFVFVWLLFHSFAVGFSQPAGFFPHELPGWQIESPPEIYAGDDLFFLIDGGADLYLEYGFKEVAVANYQKMNSKLHVEVYEMNGAEQAWGVFSVRRPAQLSSSKDNDFQSFEPTYVMAARGPYYIVVSSQSGETGADELYAFSDSFIAGFDAIPYYKTEKDPLFTSGSSGQSVLFYGRAGFMAVYSLGSSNFQNFDKGFALRKNSGKISLELHYKDQQSASSDFQQFTGKIKDSERFVVLNNSENSLLLKDRDKANVVVRFSGERIFIDIEPIS